MKGYYFVAFFCLLASCSSNSTKEKVVTNQNEIREDDGEVLSEKKPVSKEKDAADLPEKKKASSRNNTDELVLPFIQKNVCPFEGCKYRKIWKTTTAINVYKSEDQKEEVFSLKKGETFKALKGNVHILKPGKLVITEAFKDFKKGEEIPVLAYKGEGAYDLWYKGKVYNKDLPELWSMQQPKAVLKTKPETEWWIYIVSERGKFGWIHADGKIDFN